MTDRHARIGIASLLFVAIVTSTIPAGRVLVASVASFAGGYAIALRLRRSLPLSVVPLAAVCFFLAGYLVWCCWVISGSPDYWPRSLPYPDRIIGWLHSWPLLRMASPFGNWKLLLCFNAVACLSAAVSGAMTAGVLRHYIGDRPALMTSRVAGTKIRYVIGCAIGFLISFYPALLIAKSGGAAFALVPILLIAASTLLGGYIANRR